MSRRIGAGGSILVAPEELEALVAAVFRRRGVPDEQAGWAAEVLVATEMAGVSDHGVRLALAYAEQLRRGDLAADGPRRVIERDPPVLRLDGGNGLGPAVGRWAIDQAVDVAAECGACVCTVRSNHLGALAPYVERAADRGMAALVTQETPLVMAAFGGLDAVLGNAPFAISVPARDGEHLVLDMSCAVTAMAKIADAAEQGREIPPGLMLSQRGEPTTDPVEAMKGVQLPLGHKGAALAVMLGAFASAIGGAGGAVPPRGTGLPAGTRGVFMLVVDVRRFAAVDDYEASLDGLKTRIVASRASDAGSPVRYPGQRSAATRRACAGAVPVAAGVLAAIERLAEGG
jgi:LDH2 family malate/lactate/ureidoglycolate dehydrogenase